MLTVVLKAFDHAFDPVNMALIYLLPVMLSAMYGRIRPAIFTAVAGVLAFDFYFVPPSLSFTVADLRYLVSFFVFLAVAILTATLAARLKQQLYYAERREALTASLYALSRQMSAITDIRALLDNVTQVVTRTIGTEAAVFLPDENRELALASRSSSHSDWGAGESERAVARLAFEHGEPVGKGTNTLREASAYYVPFRTEDRTYGVLAVNLKEAPASFSPDNRRLLEAMADLAASAIARVKFAEEAKIAQLTAESERLRTALLDSVSHELRTPLATIAGSVTGLLEGDELFSKEERMELLTTVRDGAMRMNRLVTNLLGMAQLESGMLRLRKQWCDVGELIGVALTQLKAFQQHRTFKVSLPDELPLVLGDEALLEQLLVNMISNAIKYSPDSSEIRIEVKIELGRMAVSVADQGIGIPPAERELIFRKFYRSHTTRHLTGTGLGLAICRGIVELHRGTIAAEPNGGKGTVVSFTLPAEQTAEQHFAFQEGEN